MKKTFTEYKQQAARALKADSMFTYTMLGLTPVEQSAALLLILVDVVKDLESMQARLTELERQTFASNRG